MNTTKVIEATKVIEGIKVMNNTGITICTQVMEATQVTGNYRHLLWKTGRLWRSLTLIEAMNVLQTIKKIGAKQTIEDTQCIYCLIN